MKFGTVIASVLMVSVVGLAGAQDKMSGHKMMKPTAIKMGVAEWQKYYDQANKMFNSMNADAIFSTMTPDFTLTMMGQTQNMAQAKASMKAWFGMMKNLHCSMKVTKVSGGNTMATVVDTFTNTGMMKPDPKTHKSGKLVDKGMETATWVKMDGKWMMKKLVISNEKMTMDGKPFKPGM